MAVSSTVSFTDVQRSHRCDADHFNPDYLRLEANLDRLTCQRLPSVASVSDGNHVSISDYFSADPATGPRYLRGQDIGDFFLGARNPVYIPPTVFESLSRSHMYPGDVLLSVVGTIGALSLVPSDAPALTGSCKIAILRPRPGISSYYLAAFLYSKYGQFQIKRHTRGAVQMGLILEDMRFLRVPRLGKLEEAIANIIAESERLLHESAALYAGISGLLRHHIGAAALHTRLATGFVTKLADLAGNGRWDSEFYRPDYDDVLTACLQPGGTIRRFITLRRVVTEVTNGKTPLHHDLTVGEVPFLTAEHVSDFEIDYRTEKRVLAAHHETELARTALREWDVLMTIKGKVGNCAVVRDHPKAVNINQDVAVIRLAGKVDPYFFCAWFNSPYGRRLTRKYSTGGINPFLGLNNVKRLPFPDVDDKTQTKIGKAVREQVEAAEAAGSKAFSLIDKAAAEIDQHIERTSKQAV